MGNQVIAIDVGGTTIKGGRYDSVLNCAASIEVPTPVADGPAAIVEAIRHVARRLAGVGIFGDSDGGVGVLGVSGGADGSGLDCEPAPGRIVAAAVVVPGLVDRVRGVATYSANLGWRDVPLRDLLELDLGVPAALEHDVRAAAMAEAEFGAASGPGQSLFVAIGTGISSARIVDGRIDSGATGLAGELGHVPVHSGGEICACGQRGCLEVYASAAGISRRYERAGGESGLLSREIVQRLGSDLSADVIWAQAVEALILGLTSAIMLLDPSRLIFGGGLAESGETLLGPIRDGLADRMFWRPVPSIVMGRFGADAGRVGAAALAFALVGREGSPVRGGSRTRDGVREREGSTASEGVPVGGGSPMREAVPVLEDLSLVAGSPARDSLPICEAGRLA